MKVKEWMKIVAKLGMVVLVVMQLAVSGAMADDCASGVCEKMTQQSPCVFNLMEGQTCDAKYLKGQDIQVSVKNGGTVRAALSISNLGYKCNGITSISGGGSYNCKEYYVPKNGTATFLNLGTTENTVSNLLVILTPTQN